MAPACRGARRPRRTHIRIGEVGAVRSGMEKVRRCKYRAHYLDFKAKESREWKCDMPALPGREYCLFHDPEYWREHPEEVRKAFYERVREAMANEGPPTS